MTCKGSPGVCILKGVVYQCTCNVCEAEGKNAKYFGETARSMYERIQEHKKLIEKKSQESPVIENHEEQVIINKLCPPIHFISIIKATGYVRRKKVIFGFTSCLPLQWSNVEHAGLTCLGLRFESQWGHTK